MRLTTRALTRSWLILAAAVVTALPAGVASAAVRPVKPPHVVGGYVASTFRVPAKKAHAGIHANEVLPATVDLRQYAPTPGNQGQISNCVAWTIAYGIMGYYANRTGGVGAPYAPLYLYMRNVAAGGAPNAGLNPDAVLANAAAAGVDTQEDYWQGTSNWQSSPTQAQIANAANYKIDGWHRLWVGANQGDAAKTAVMQAMASGSPVAFGFPVYQDFMSLKTHTLYNTLTGASLGGHMVAAYGYDTQGVYIRNSWGAGWGNGGDAKLSWAFVTKVINGGYTVDGLDTPAEPIAMPPTVAALSVAKGAPGTSVTVTGAGLADATAVEFGDATATFVPLVENGATKLVATVPSMAAGAVDVTVTNDSGTSAVSTASKFTVQPPPPSISDLTPDTASTFGGTTVTVTGANLTGVTSVKLGTVTAAAKAVSATSLTFVAPARAASTVAVTAANTYGVSSAAQLVYAVPSAPAVTGLTPDSGLTTATTKVVVTGTNFVGVTKVSLGGKTVPFAKISDTSLSATLPAHAAEAVALQVTTPAGQSSATDDSSFTYVPPPPPAITSITPGSGPNYKTTPVVLTGQNLATASKVTVGGVTAPFTKVSATSLKVTMPTHAAGSVDVLVTTPAGGVSAAGAGATFTYVAPPAPVITTVTPSSGLTYKTVAVKLTGENFGLTTKVTVGGVVSPFTKVSDTEIKITLKPRDAGAASVAVTTPGGVSVAATYTAVAPPAPEVTSLSVETGLTTAITVVKLTGVGFTDASKVTLDGKAVAFTKGSDTELTVKAPAHAAGDVPIVVTAPGGVSAAATFTYELPPAPVVAAMSPAFGQPAKTAVVTITGAGFTTATKVTLDGKVVTFTKVSDTQLKVTLPAKTAGTYDLMITGPGGTSEVDTASQFRYGA